MKNKLVILFFLLSQQVNANHIFGGEITWQCLKSGPNVGKYIFTLKVYRDCNGVSFTPPTSLFVYSTDTVAAHNPSTWAIPLNAGIFTDISPSFCSPTCNTGGPGTVQEIVQTSPPTTLSGIPPATGWVIEYDECCRGMSVNLFNANGFTLRSVMYPYNNQNTNPCFDSSPAFAEQPLIHNCAGYNFTYNPMAIDPDCDSVVYGWGNLIDQPTNPPPQPFSAYTMVFNLPYSVNNQFTGNPFLDSLSGHVSANPSVAGLFATCINASSYRCGVKVSEVYRDVAMDFSNGCTISNTSNLNVPPVVNAPFQNSQTGLYTDYVDTVHACDTVRFFLNGTDFQIGTAAGNNFNLQSVHFYGSGSEFGAGFTNPNAGCLIPPCATTNPALPTPFVQGGVGVSFMWPVCLSHLCDCGNCNDTITEKTYYFDITASDNYCPSSGKNVQTIRITVLPPAIINVGGTLMFNMAMPLNYTYQWYLNGVAISGAIFSSYTPSQNGNYTVVINNGGACNMLSGPFTFPTGINFPLNSKYVSIHPNPVTDFLDIKFKEYNHENYQLSVYDITGKIILENELQKNSYNNRIDVSSITKGIYLVEIKNKAGQKMTNKIVKL